LCYFMEHYYDVKSVPRMFSVILQTFFSVTFVCLLIQCTHFVWFFFLSQHKRRMLYRATLCSRLVLSDMNIYRSNVIQKAIEFNQAKDTLLPILL